MVERPGDIKIPFPFTNISVSYEKKTAKSAVQFITVSSRFTTIALIILLTEGQNLKGIFFSNKARFFMIFDIRC